MPAGFLFLLSMNSQAYCICICLVVGYDNVEDDYALCVLVRGLRETAAPRLIADYFAGIKNGG